MSNFDSHVMFKMIKTGASEYKKQQKLKENLMAQAFEFYIVQMKWSIPTYVVCSSLWFHAQLHCEYVDD